MTPNPLATYAASKGIDFAEFGKLFTNDDVWKQLRPMIYTYWC